AQFAEYATTGTVSHLNDAVQRFQLVLDQCPVGHPDHEAALTNLASARLRGYTQNHLQDIDTTISLFREALALRPQGHPDHASSLLGLIRALTWRYGKESTVVDIHESAQLMLELCSLGYQFRHKALHRLSQALETRFQQCGSIDDINETIQLRREAVSLCPQGHSDRSLYLNDLAVSLGQHRFKQQGNPNDLDEAISLHEEALRLRSVGHESRHFSLDNLGLALTSRFRARGDIDDITRAISLHREALRLRPPGHPQYDTTLNNLAVALDTRYDELHVSEDLDEAIDWYRESLRVKRLDHPERHLTLFNLSGALCSLFIHTQENKEVEEAISFCQESLEVLPSLHPDRFYSYHRLGQAYITRYCVQYEPADLSLAVENFRLASGHPTQGFPNRILNTLWWVDEAESHRHDSALEAYQVFLELFDNHVMARSSIVSRREAATAFGDTHSLPVDAASCAIRHDNPRYAVELAEHGRRAVFWTQLARFRTTLDELSKAHHTGAILAEEFKQLSFCLRNAFDQSTEDQSPQIRQVTMEWDDVVSRIRMLPDFSRFLLPPLFSDLRKAAEEGPVIIVNASQYSCDALIVLSDRDPVHVPTNTTQTEVSDLSTEFQSLSKEFGSFDTQHKLVKILRKLWHDIVDPVVQALGASNVHPGSRIWWCPTAEFTLLPLHAAGLYEKKRDSLPHIYISSYTPTLATLVRARQQVPRDASPQYFVAIGQGNPDGGKPLECVAPELAVVAQRLAPIASSFTLLEDSDATVKAAVNVLNHHQWLHLACHGMPNRKRPFESSFAMRDGPLMIKDIIRSDWQNPEFAFLSACHTTVGDEKSPDESIHLAAAMQFSGFRSVIGSMWSVDDEVAQEVVSAFYGNLVDGSGRLDCTRAAMALHKAVKKLRRSNVPLEQQIVFVHIGV
ncbi:hypothetical protein CY34DRAFT_91959, partial [Suillus luteus UH-Slu-Lm8-n1]